MADPEGIAIVAAVVAVLLLRRLIPRLLLGFDTFRDPEEIHRRLQGDESLVVLDVRTPGEFHGELGHIPGAVNVPVSGLKRVLAEPQGPLAEIDRDRPIVAVCRTDNRSPRAAGILRRAGFTRVLVLSGGMSAWSGEGFPVEQ